ncbi:adenylate/guanylate cyclase domain-containing protein [Candidatus Neomarinimicrobiota bacterium]
MAETTETHDLRSAEMTTIGLSKRIRQAVQSSLETSYANTNAFLTAAAILTVVGHLLFYVIWRYFYPQPVENLLLRLVGCSLAIPFLFRNRLPERLVPFMPLYFIIAVVFNLPIVFSYLMIQNDFSQVWVLSTLGAAFVLTFLVEWRAVIVLFILAVLFWGGFGIYHGGGESLTATLKYVVIFLFPLVFGGIFSYRLQKYRENQSKLEKRIRKITDENARIMREQNQLLALFLSNTIVARLRQFQKKFGLEEAITMITHQERRFCGIMEADIRNFTRMFSYESELEVARLISRCFTEITDIGQDLAVIKPVGDALFMYSDDEYGRENSVPNILSLAIFFVHSLQKVNEVLVAGGATPLNFGIAVHAGDVIYGNLASETLIDPTIIGIDVNKTARLEELTKIPEIQKLVGINAILISEEAARLGKNFISNRMLIEVDLDELEASVRDFPEVRKVFALPSEVAVGLYDRALEQIQAQRSQMPVAAGEMEANTYHGIPYYYEMKGLGPHTTWSIMIDAGALPAWALYEHSLQSASGLEVEVRKGDGQWLILNTSRHPGEFDETDIEERIFTVIRELEGLAKPVHA